MADETTPKPRSARKTRQGRVSSDKMTKTVTVTLTRQFAHRVYSKQITRTKGVKAHDELGARTGDLVKIMETRPIAKTVRWRVVEILERAK